MTTQLKKFNPAQVKQAAEETADPAAIFTEALGALPTNPAALYQDHVISALKTLRQKDEAAYTRIVVQAKGYTTRLDKLTAPEREHSDDCAQDNIISIAKNNCALSHDPDGRGVAIIEDNEIRMVWYIDSSGFQDWLRAAYFDKTKSGINETSLAAAIATLAAIGKHQGAEVTVHVRCALHADAYYIDLCDDLWRAIRIDKGGWEVVVRPPVLFTRTKNMRSLPPPEKPGDLSKLWQHINIPETRRLPLLAWLADAYRPDTPFPILELSGEQGSAKSSTQRRLRDLLDPNKVPLRGRPKTVEDIYVGAANNWVVSLENISHLTPEQQDVLCTLSTGGGFSSRQFYTNGDEFVLETKRPVMINGINAVATQPDLIERVIGIEAPNIPPEQRQDEQALEAAWEADHPSILAGVLDLFSEALRLLPEVKLKQKHRMADYQKLGEAIARALDHPEGHFTALYGEAVAEGVERGLETYGVANAVQVLMCGQQKPWNGTVQDLLGDLYQLSGVDRSNWPKSPRGLSGQLKRLAPGLRLRGIVIEKLPKTRDGAQISIALAEST